MNSVFLQNEFLETLSCTPPFVRTPAWCLCDHIQRRDAPCHALQASAPASSSCGGGGGGGGRLCLFLEEEAAAAALTIFFRHISERPSAPVFWLCFDTQVEKAIRPPRHTEAARVPPCQVWRQSDKKRSCVPADPCVDTRWSAAAAVVRWLCDQRSRLSISTFRKDLRKKASRRESPAHSRPI